MFIMQTCSHRHGIPIFYMDFGKLFLSGKIYVLHFFAISDILCRHALCFPGCTPQAVAMAFFSVASHLTWGAVLVDHVLTLFPGLWPLWMSDPQGPPRCPLRKSPIRKKICDFFAPPFEISNETDMLSVRDSVRHFE